jgi:8-oxo-dGTP pyrophosphatase MutT (NUDIX family)
MVIMNRSSFLQRFVHASLQHLPQITEHKGNRKAAVLIPLVERENGLNVIFTERALHLRHHPGQVSFPGGKHEKSDDSLQQTALRETAEEIGIQSNLVEIVGQLPTLNTTSGFEVSPFIAFVDNKFNLTIDFQEVKSVFEVPLSFLLDEKNFHRQHLIANKRRHFTYCIAYQNHLIWGATAQMTKNLQQMINQ